MNYFFQFTSSFVIFLTGKGRGGLLRSAGKLLDSTFRGLAPDRRTIPPQNFEFIHALFDARERIEEVGMPVALCTAGGTERCVVLSRISFFVASLWVCE